MTATQHGAGHDYSCVCWQTRPCGCYLWDEDCPNYSPITEYEENIMNDKPEPLVPEIKLPESAFAEGYTVQLGDQRFTQHQWELIQLYAEGVARLAVEEEPKPDFEAGVTAGVELERAYRGQPGHKAQRQVRAFHQAMGQPAPDAMRPLPADRVPVRIELIREEFMDELLPALGASVSFNPNGTVNGDITVTGEQDLVEVIDAAIDILYVVYGLLVEMGVPAELFFDEVQASNMSKLGADGKPIIAGPNDPDGIFPGRVKKGPNYFKPRIKELVSEVLFDQTYFPQED